MKRRWLMIVILLLVVLAGWLAYGRLTVAPPSSTELQSSIRAPIPQAGTVEDQARRRVLGVWQDQYQGKRTMTLNDDGTGTMLVELSGVSAVLYASQLTFDMTWSLEGKKLFKKTIGGKPANKVNLILNTMGDTAEDTILEVTEDNLLLLDKDGKTQYNWRRVPPEEKTKP